MSLSSALSIARSGLTVAAQQTDIVSRNMANSGTEGVTRKWANLSTEVTGGVTVTSVERSVDTLLQRLDRENMSKLAQQSTVSDGLSAYTSFLGQPDDQISPAAKLSDLQNSLVLLSTLPSEESTQIQVVTAAKAMASQLNDLSGTIGDINAEVERNIRYDVSSANEVLEEIAALNQKILRTEDGSMTEAGYLDELDQKLDEMSSFMDIQTVTSNDGTINLYTGAGTELVIGNTAKTVSYDPVAGTLSAGSVDITPNGDGRGVMQGSLSGLFELRDEQLPQLSAQLDALAAGLVSTMQDANPFGTGGTGLFTDAGNVFDPASVEGLAGRISVNAEVDNTAGGSPSLLQSGGDPATPLGDSSYITAMLDGFNDSLTVDLAGLGDSLTLAELAPALVSQQQSLRATAEAATQTTQSAGETIAASRSNFEGVNIDDELQKLLVIEQSYAANARVLTSINQMLDTLIQSF